MIYLVDDEILRLERTGTNADLFGYAHNKRLQK
ncbi:MAG TPA: hypothetical protein PLB25_21095 [Rhodoferax sp.]|nr:hypothetical protein [Rhodoferax sp.]